MMFMILPLKYSVVVVDFLTSSDVYLRQKQICLETVSLSLSSSSLKELKGHRSCS